MLVLGGALAACDRSGSNDEKSPRATSPRSADSLTASTLVPSAIATDTAVRTLATAGGKPYRALDNVSAQGLVVGHVHSVNPLPVDSVITPDTDSVTCTPFLDVTAPQTRGDKSGSVGNAVVWLVGVSAGPRDTASRRIGLQLDRCQLVPRVQRAPAGATVVASTRDNIMADLRFFEVGHPASSPRAVVHFTGSGQVVPTSLALVTPGLVEVRDDRHGWVRGYIAVAPHPFVAVTAADGKFAFVGVPPGTYGLVAWHERLGARVSTIVVKAGAASSVSVEY